MKAAIFTTDTEDDGRIIVFATDPVLTEALNPSREFPVQVMTHGYGQHEAAWMLEDLRVFWIAYMLEEGIPIPDDYREYIERARAMKWRPMKRWTRFWRDFEFRLMRLPYALRDALDGVGVPAKWIRSETTVRQIQAAQQAAVKAAQVLSSMQQGADVAATLAGAQKDQAVLSP